MAQILREVLGDKLFVPHPDDPMEAWKSPEELKHKVVCRTSVRRRRRGRGRVWNVGRKRGVVKGTGQRAGGRK